MRFLVGPKIDRHTARDMNSASRDHFNHNGEGIPVLFTHTISSKVDAVTVPTVYRNQFLAVSGIGTKLSPNQFLGDFDSECVSGLDFLSPCVEIFSEEKNPKT